MPSNPIPVFIGSASLEMSEERRKVEESLQSLAPRIEVVNAAERAQIYVGIFGGRDDALAGEEYERARKKGMKCFRYVKGAAHREGDAFNDLDAMIIALKADLRSRAGEKAGFGKFLAQVRAFAASMGGRALIVAVVAMLAYLGLRPNGELTSSPPSATETPAATVTPESSPRSNPTGVPSVMPAPGVGLASPSPLSAPSPAATKATASPAPSPRPSPTPRPSATPKPSSTLRLPPTPRPSPIPPPSLRISPARLRFNAAGARTITFTNDRPNQILVSGIALEQNSGHFRVASDGCRDRTLKQGERCDVSIHYAPASGSSETPGAQLTIEYGYDQSQMTVRKVPMGRDAPAVPVEISVTPDNLTFGSQRVGSSSNPQLVTLKNDGPGRIRVREVSVTREGGVLSLGATRHFTAGQECKRVLGPGESCRISVSFTPRDSGNRHAELRIQARPEGISGPGDRKIVTLNGTATQF